MCICHTQFFERPALCQDGSYKLQECAYLYGTFFAKKALTTFHYSLNERGYLLLGKSETTNITSELFLSADKKEKLYIRKSLPAKFMSVTSSRREEALKDKDYGLRSNEQKKDDFQKNADDILLSKYTPPGVIVNEQLDIVQFRGSTGAYLEPSPGKASLNVLKMARDGLAFELRNALHKSKLSGESFVKENIPINPAYGQTASNKKNEETGTPRKFVTIEVIPLLDTIDLHFLILFRDAIQKDEVAKAEKNHNRQLKQQENGRIRLLEKDLSQAREDMRSITEEQEAANEELQSANEELLSGSEELQSLNEELETSKEELQSTNEELITVNQELYDRNEQLNQARIYAEGIITTIHEPMIVLTADFRVKSANESFYKNFSIAEKDTLGKVIFDLQNLGWNIPGLRQHLERLQQKRDSFLEWEVTYEFPVAGERTIRFNAQPIPEEQDRHLILLALDDVTLQKEAEKVQGLQTLRQILETIPQITFSATASGNFIYFNNFFLDYAGISMKQALQSGWLAVILPEQYEAASKAWEHSIKPLRTFIWNFSLKEKVMACIVGISFVLRLLSTMPAK